MTPGGGAVGLVGNSSATQPVRPASSVPPRPTQRRASMSCLLFAQAALLQAVTDEDAALRVVAAAPHNSSQALWALQENLAHARSDLHAAAVGEGDPTGERQRDALRAARLRLRAARTVLTAATAASAAAAE